MKNRLLNGLGALAVSTATLFNSGCEMCSEPGYYDEYPPYYQPAPCFQQPVYFQQAPCPSIYNGSQAISPSTHIYNRNGINSAPIKISETKTEPAPKPPKPVPEEISKPEAIQTSNPKSLKPAK